MSRRVSTPSLSRLTGGQCAQSASSVFGQRDGASFRPTLSGADRGSSVVQVSPQGAALLERGTWKVADQGSGSRRET